MPPVPDKYIPTAQASGATDHPFAAPTAHQDLTLLGVRSQKVGSLQIPDHPFVCVSEGFFSLKLRCLILKDSAFALSQFEPDKSARGQSHPGAGD